MGARNLNFGPQTTDPDHGPWSDLRSVDYVTSERDYGHNIIVLDLGAIEGPNFWYESVQPLFVGKFMSQRGWAKCEGKIQGRGLGQSTLTWTLPHLPRPPPWLKVSTMARGGLSSG
uniref:Uncharacterized protein n=1 Tax=Solanum tuberosum TaxID=4113 RepID=M1DW03_SOLTU